MKAIMISIKPQWVAKILNGEKTIEIRKKFSKDYVGWVYIYCTKNKKYANLINRGGFLTGMVVARLWCDKVEEISYTYLVNARSYSIKSCLTANQFSKECCLEQWELDDYLQGKNGKAIHITKLEIFDKPKELKEFYVYSHSVSGIGMDGEPKTFEILKPLTKAPQSWQFIEV